MFLKSLIKKSIAISLLAAGGIGIAMASTANNGIDTVVMAKTKSGYLCSDVVKLEKDAKPSIHSLSFKRCDTAKTGDSSVRILVI